MIFSIGFDKTYIVISYNMYLLYQYSFITNS